MENLVEVAGLEKKIDDFHLGPIHLNIEPGTITALVGNNGSGKSTLLKLMMNLIKTNTGNIHLFNQSIHDENENWKVHIAYQPQTFIGYDGFTGKSLRDLISKWYPTWDDALFQDIVQRLDIDLNKRFDKLSQGSQQKLGIALTIARNAQLLILDEPTSFIDIPSKTILIDLLVEWIDQSERRSILIASHQAEDIQKLADYITILRSGNLIGKFTKEELTENYKRYWVNQTLPTMNIPGETLRENNMIISNKPEETEQYFSQHNLEWSSRTAVELDDIITLLLTRKER